MIPLPIPPRPHGPAPAGAFDEEIARAELYGLLALLYYAPPSSDVLLRLRAAATEAPAAGALLEAPWRALVGLAREMTEPAIKSEYDDLFGGIGKPEIYLYASWYLSGFLNEKPLARLRADLARLGLARDEKMSETEDHVACLCEVMRYLIAGEDAAVADLPKQREFFAHHLQPWVRLLCEATESHPKARFYAALAVLTREFMAVEAQGFGLLD